MIIKGAIRIRMGHVKFSCHSFFFVHLAVWSPSSHQYLKLVFRQFLGEFDVTHFFCRFGSFAFQLALRLHSTRILVAFRSHFVCINSRFVRISFALRSHFVRILFAFCLHKFALRSHFVCISFALRSHFVRIFFAFRRIYAHFVRIYAHLIADS